jgi:hypothetical protein
VTDQQEQDELTEPDVTPVPEPDQDAHEPVPDEADAPPPPIVGTPIGADFEDDDEPDDDDEPPAEPPPASEKELRAIGDKLEREDERHARRVEEIMGEAALDLIQCPTCIKVAAGWLYPPRIEPLPAEAEAGMRALLGLPDTAILEPDPTKKLCPRCKGHGRLATPSLVQGYTEVDCGLCANVGYVTKAEQQTNGAGEPEAVPVLTGPTAPESFVGDPMVESLKSRGFTVIPPPPTGA